MNTYKYWIEKDGISEFADEIIYRYLKNCDDNKGYDGILDFDIDNTMMNAVLMYSMLTKINTETGVDSELSVKYASKVVCNYLKYEGDAEWRISPLNE